MLIPFSSVGNVCRWVDIVFEHPVCRCGGCFGVCGPKDRLQNLIQGFTSLYYGPVTLTEAVVLVSEEAAAHWF